MNQKLMAGLLSAAMMTGALSGTALAGELRSAPDLSTPPANVTIAPRTGALISLRPDTVIAPNPQGLYTRSMLVQALWEMSGKPVVNNVMTFSDVTSTTEAAEAIRWAAAEQIASGYGDGTFGPDNRVTREQMAAMAYRYVQKFGMGFQGQWMFLMPYSDRADVSQWAFEPVMWMVSSRLFDTEQKELKPQESVSQSEAQTFLDKLAALGQENQVNFSLYAQITL